MDVSWRQKHCEELAAQEIKSSEEPYYATYMPGSCSVTVVGKQFPSGELSPQATRHFSIDLETREVTDYSGWTARGPIPDAIELCQELAEKLKEILGVGWHELNMSRFGKCLLKTGDHKFSIDILNQKAIEEGSSNSIDLTR